MTRIQYRALIRLLDLAGQDIAQAVASPLLLEEYIGYKHTLEHVANARTALNLTVDYILIENEAREVG